MIKLTFTELSSKPNTRSFGGTEERRAQMFEGRWDRRKERWGSDL